MASLSSVTEFEEVMSLWILGMNYDISFLCHESINISHVLDDIGVTAKMVAYLRRIYLSREVATTLSTDSLHPPISVYHFGSKTEGTTTLDMGSDLDSLQCINCVNIFHTDNEWTPGKLNLRVLRGLSSAPRHCFLLPYEEDTPEPIKLDIVPSTSIDVEGRILMQNTVFLSQDIEVFTQGGKPFIKHGPSVSNTEDRDFVTAYFCKQLPLEYQRWQLRPRSGQWPSSQLLIEASKCGSFLLAVGHPESETGLEEWRFSTSLIERTLMFHLNIVQIKVYILLKLIRNHFIKPVVGDHLTSFSLKCVLLFTVENSPCELWTKEENLLCCILLCLNTLRRILTITYCPHYVLQTNLFVGKLPYNEMNKVLEIVLHIMQDPVQSIYSIQSDGLGPRLLELRNFGSYVSEQFLSRLQTHLKIGQNCLLGFTFRVMGTMNVLLETVNDTCSALVIERHLKVYQRFMKSGTKIEQSVASILFPECCSLLASIQASLCSSIWLKRPISLKTLKLFYISMSGNIALKLKFASFCYCRGELNLTESLLHSIETMYHGQMIAACECKNTDNTGNRQLPKAILNIEDISVMNSYIAHCVKFTKLESKCAPEHLAYEMMRSTVEDRKSRKCEAGKHDKWMDMICVDCLPFLFYLQFLTFHQSKSKDQQTAALSKLKQYVLDADIDHGHYETSLNILGHCFELQGDSDAAIEVYKLSLEVYPNNNAAQWYIKQRSDPVKVLCNIAANNKDFLEAMKSVVAKKDMVEILQNATSNL